MKVLFDLLPLVTESRERGIGAYTKQLIRHLEPSKYNIDVIFCYPAIDKEHIIFAERELDKIGYQHKRMPYRLLTHEPWNEHMQRVNAHIFLSVASELGIDILHRSAMFENNPYIAAHISMNSKPYLQTAIFYDFIPLIERSKYLSAEDNAFANDYLNKVSSISKCDHLFAISNASKQEYLSFFPSEESNITNVSTAANILPSNNRSSSKKETKKYSNADQGGKKNFILYVGGIDARKNLPRLIQAYALLPKEIQIKYDLFLAGPCPSQARQALSSLAGKLNIVDNIQILGHVDDKQLSQLYQESSLLVFPSLREGFGIPPLEAMHHGCPVVCSDINAMHEVVAFSESYFDPNDTVSISNKIVEFLTDTKLRLKSIDHGYQQAEKFKWQYVSARISHTWKRLKELSAGSPYSPSFSKLPAIEHFSKSLRLMHPADEEYISRNILQINKVFELNRGLTNNIDAASVHYKLFNGLARSGCLPNIKIQVEGPFDSSYSLSIVNKEMAKAIAAISGSNVRLRALEAGIDYQPNSHFLSRDIHASRLYDNYLQNKASTPDLSVRYCYPPRADNMNGRCNSFHSYGWEESFFPDQWIEEMQGNLDYVTTMSSFSRKVLIDSGLQLPVFNTGLGVDAITKIDSEISYPKKDKVFRFLHISSCFPRKSPEILVEAFMQAFLGLQDRVELFIKTFENPHNEIEAILRNAQEKYPNAPQIIICYDELSYEEIKGLYCSSDAYISLSRGEGFCLPLAEAVLCDLPVISTNYSGPKDFLDSASSILVDFKFERASSHLSNSLSVWANPDITAVKNAMYRLFLSSPESRYVMAQRAKKGLQGLDWRSVATNNLHVYNTFLSDTTIFKRVRQNPRFGVVSTWGSQCGISQYAENLFRDFKSPFIVYTQSSAIDLHPFTSQDVTVKRCFRNSGELLGLSDLIVSDEIDIVIIQWNDSFFDYHYFKEFIDCIKANEIVVIIDMHATLHSHLSPHKSLAYIVETLSKADRILVHTCDDLNRLKSLGVVDNLVFFPHPEFRPHHRDQLQASPSTLTFATFGFLLPQKNILNVVKAFASLYNEGFHGIRLKCLNSFHPSYPEGRAIAEDCLAVIDRNSLGNVAYMNNDFLSDEQLTAELNSADVAIFAYSNHNESASGAVRHAVRAGCTIGATNYPMLSDIAEFSFPIASESVKNIKDFMLSVIDSYANAPAVVLEKRQMMMQRADLLSWDKMSRRLHDLARSVWINSANA